MYISTNLIILWTCAKEDVDETRCWYLKRIDPSSKETNQGPLLPRTKDTRSHEFILGDMLLEREEMEFDFEYSHQDGDILIVKYNGHRFVFQSEYGKFIHAPEDYIFTPTVDVAQGRFGGYASRQKH